eukprot:2838121-Rhodomonas_salina.2
MAMCWASWTWPGQSTAQRQPRAPDGDAKQKRARGHRRRETLPSIRAGLGRLLLVSAIMWWYHEQLRECPSTPSVSMNLSSLSSCHAAARCQCQEQSVDTARKRMMDESVS